MEDQELVEKIKKHYPEGLTAFVSVGSTRTAYVMKSNIDANDPGSIKNFSDYVQWSWRKICDIIKNFMELGGSNVIFPGLVAANFNRGDDYVNKISDSYGTLISNFLVDFYHENNIDPYFVGTEAWLYPSLNELPMREAAQRLIDFQKTWPYQPNRKKLIIEIGGIPLSYYILQLCEKLAPQDIQAVHQELSTAHDINDMTQILYAFFIKKIYGISVPSPHLAILGATRGTLKIHTTIPSALTASAYLKLFYVPYPILFMPRKTLKTILIDLVLPKSFISSQTDYSGMYSSEQLKADFKRMEKLMDNERTTLGLSREFGRKV